MKYAVNDPENNHVRLRFPRENEKEAVPKETASLY